MGNRTDLAMEERELWQRNAKKTSKLHGVRARERKGKGMTVTTVEILDERGASALHKPVGTYVTLQWEKNLLRSPAGFRAAAERLGYLLSQMVPEGDVLVVGLGNAAVTPDAVGPWALNHLMITRHLRQYYPSLRQVSAVAPGVLGTTGLESVDVVRGLVERTEPACVVVVDALASCTTERVCSTVQLTDTGIAPGSGVGNSRESFSKASLGIPVVAVGVPTVVEVSALLEQTLLHFGVEDVSCSRYCDPSMVVTPKDMDARVASAARLLGYGISIGLHRGISLEDVSCFVG